jgi:ABC-type xylose transport system permease subunit
MSGDESLAHKGILIATWAGRVNAILELTPLVVALPRQRGIDWTVVAFAIGLCAAQIFLAERVKRGRRLAALFLLVGNLLAAVGSWQFPLPPANVALRN